MSIPSAGAILIFATISTSAMGGVTTTVVDVPTRGATERFLYLHSDAPAANIVVLPGGDGTFGIGDDGTMTAPPRSAIPSPAIDRRLPIMVSRSPSSMRLPMALCTI
jgi:hypothetical protein